MKLQFGPQFLRQLRPFIAAIGVRLLGSVLPFYCNLRTGLAPKKSVSLLY
jgi:hypothetical protein